MTPSPALLQLNDLVVEFRSRAGQVRAIDGVSLTLNAGETLAIVGESGSGKSVTALAIMGLISTPPGRITRGEVLLDGADLLSLSEGEMQAIRGNDIAMIFQDPMSSLNPVMTVGRQISEAVELHQKVDRRRSRERSLDMLRLVQIPEPEARLGQYPHELSGGMRQRVMIAMALACQPRILIADEPTTALDVTLQAQILDLMRDLKARSDTAILLITHDLGVVAEMADRVAVFYAGRKVEEAPVRDLLADPRHPYTRGLIAAIPHLTPPDGQVEAKRLAEIPGTVPVVVEDVIGCTFAPRCAWAVDKCRTETPPLLGDGRNRSAACWFSGLQRPET